MSIHQPFCGTCCPENQSNMHTHIIWGSLLQNSITAASNSDAEASYLGGACQYSQIPACQKPLATRQPYRKTRVTSFHEFHALPKAFLYHVQPQSLITSHHLESGKDLERTNFIHVRLPPCSLDWCVVFVYLHKSLFRVLSHRRAMGRSKHQCLNVNSLVWNRSKRVAPFDPRVCGRGKLEEPFTNFLTPSSKARSVSLVVMEPTRTLEETGPGPPSRVPYWED